MPWFSAAGLSQTAKINNLLLKSLIFVIILIKGNLDNNNGDEDLFASFPTSARLIKEQKIQRQASAFTPTFLDSLTVPDSVRLACRNDTSCISDTLISGLPSMGAATLSGLTATQESIAQISNKEFFSIYIS
jgi:hypothetical protein